MANATNDKTFKYNAFNPKMGVALLSFVILSVTPRCGNLKKCNCEFSCKMEPVS